MHPAINELLERLASSAERLAQGAAGDEGRAVAGDIRGAIDDLRRLGERADPLYHRLAEGIPDGLFRLRLDDRSFEYLNPAMEAVGGYLRGEMCGRPGAYRRVVHPHWADFVERVLAEMDQGRNAGEYEIAVLTRKGEERRLLLRTSLVRENGRPTHVEGVARDVTDSRIAERVLQRHMFMTDATRDPMSLIGRDYRYKAVNRSFMVAVQGVCRTPVGRHVSEVWGERVFSGIIKKVLDRCLAGEEVTYEAWFAFPGQPEGFFEVSYMPYREKGAGVTHVVVISRDLTRRKRAEEQGRRADARFRQVVESINDIIVTMDRDRRLTYVSPAMERLAGMRPDQVQDRPLDDFVHAEDRGELRRAFEDLERGREAVGEFRFLTKEGESIWMRLAARALEEDGELVGAAGRLTNISVRKRAEEALARSERKYRDIFENIQDIYFETDGMGRVLEISPAVERLTFYTRSEIMDKGVLPLMRDPAERGPMLEELDKTGYVTDREIGFLDKDGSHRFFSITARVVHEDGTRKVVGSLHDVTVRRQAQREAEQAKEALDRIIDAVPDPLYVKDERHRYLMVNRAMCALFGRERDEMVGRTTFDIHDPEQAGHFAEMDDQAFISGGAVVHEEDYLDSAGVPRLLVVSKAVFEEAGERLLVGVIRDMTEARRMQEELRSARDQAEYLAESKSRFLANMSHEIRTPLNGVIGMLQLLSLGELVEEQQEYLTTALGAGQALLAVINDILDYSKIESARMDMPCMRFSVREVLNTVERALAEQARSKGVALGVEVSGAVPELVEGAEPRLRQILFNLLGNAVKFTDAGGVEVRVHCFERDDLRADLQLYFEIEDTGIGIPDESLSRIFDPFMQVDDSDSRRFQGTGLGLGIVQRLVQALGGTLCVLSEMGRGTLVAFTVFVNRARGEQCCEFCQAAHDPPEPEGPGLRILVVEDNRVNMVLARRFLRKLGHESAGAENGEKALQMLDKAFAEGRGYDAVLMDIQMPVLDGAEATRRIREGYGAVPGDLPIVALTAHAMEGDMERYLGLGMDGYLAKPLDFGLFADLLRELLAGRAHPAGEDGEA